MAVRDCMYALRVAMFEGNCCGLNLEDFGNPREARRGMRHYYTAPLDVPPVDRRGLIRFPFAFDCVSANVVIKYARMLQLHPAPIARSTKLYSENVSSVWMQEPDLLRTKSHMKLPICHLQRNPGATDIIIERKNYMIYEFETTFQFLLQKKWQAAFN